MTECEVCGKTVSNPKKVNIDGVLLSVCDSCVKLGKDVTQPDPVQLGRKSRESFEEPQELVADFSQVVRKSREKRGMRQEEAAHRMGISSSLLRRIEGGMKPDENTIKKIQRFYGISLYKKA